MPFRLLLLRENHSHLSSTRWCMLHLISVDIQIHKLTLWKSRPVILYIYCHRRRQSKLCFVPGDLIKPET